MRDHIDWRVIVPLVAKADFELLQSIGLSFMRIADLGTVQTRLGRSQYVLMVSLVFDLLYTRDQTAENRLPDPSSFSLPQGSLIVRPFHQMKIWVFASYGLVY